MSAPHDPHQGPGRSDALAHTFPPLPRQGEGTAGQPPGPPPITLSDLPDKAFLERQRRSMARDAFWGRVVFVLAILALLVANTLAQRAHTRDLLQNIDWDRQHQSGLEDEVEAHLDHIEARLLAIEQRLPPLPAVETAATQAGPEEAPGAARTVVPTQPAQP